AVKREAAVKTHRESSSTAVHVKAPSVSSAAVASEWDYLPPLPDILEGVTNFTRHYFQLGFIPLERFLARIREADPRHGNGGRSKDGQRSVTPFLLLSILSI